MGKDIMIHLADDYKDYDGDEEEDEEYDEMMEEWRFEMSTYNY